MSGPHRLCRTHGVPLVRGRPGEGSKYTSCSSFLVTRSGVATRSYVEQEVEGGQEEGGGVEVGAESEGTAVAFRSKAAGGLSGEWQASRLAEESHPFRSRLPMFVVYRRVGERYQPWLLLAESLALSERLGLSGEYGVYCVRKGGFSAPRPAGLEGWREDVVGPYGGKCLCERTGDQAAFEAAVEAARLGGRAHYLMQHGTAAAGWELWDGDTNELPWLKFANDPRGTGLEENTMLKGRLLVASTDIPCAAELDWGKIREAELLWSYSWSAERWEEVEKGGGPVVEEGALEGQVRMQRSFTVGWRSWATGRRQMEAGGAGGEGGGGKRSASGRDGGESNKRASSGAGVHPHNS